ncbi:MAG: hypothetical protein O2807_13090 [bacterium]|nr:hypothetical protein [bacterium]
MADFVTGLIKRYAADDRFTMEPDPAGKGIKLRMNENCWMELEKLDDAGKLRISFATIDRYMNEDIEHAILDSKDPIDDFVYDGMEESGEEEEHEVKHYHDDAFRYAIELDLDKAGLDAQAARVLDGLFLTFEEYAEKD